MSRALQLSIIFAAVLSLSFSAEAKTYQLKGSQQAGSVGRSAKTGGNTLVLKKPAVITRIDCRADSYTIWKDGKAFATGEKKNRIEGQLPPGRYILRTSPGRVTIHLDDQAEPKLVTLWAKQKKGPKHWIKRNTVVLGSPHLIRNYRYDGTDGGTISSVVNNRISPRPMYRFISAHNKRDKGPAYIGPKGKKLKTWKGKALPAGAYICTPGIGTADHIVTLEVQLRAK